MADTKWSQFPSATPDSADEVVGLHAGGNARFSLANLVYAVRNGLGNIFQSKITANGILKGDGAGGVSAAVAGTDYQAPLTIDATPTANSTNPVQSGGVYTDVRTRVPVYGKGVNLLRNWYFVGGGTGRGVFPVNQRGQSSYGPPPVASGIYGIDGWLVTNRWSDAISVTGSGVQITATNYYQELRQILDMTTKTFLLGKQVTYSCFYNDGVSDVLVSSTTNFPDSFPSADTYPINNTPLLFCLGPSNMWAAIRVPASSTFVIKAVKLELGSEQTLAHQENGVWVLNEIPDYEYELYRCITSTADPSDTYANKSLATEQQLAYVETGTTASRNISAGEYFCWSGLLYRAKTAIPIGGTFTPNTNCEQTSVGDELEETHLNKVGVFTNVNDYDANNKFTAPCDGYLVVYAMSVGSYAMYYVTGPDEGYDVPLYIAGEQSFYVQNSLFIRKGMKIFKNATSGTWLARFFPLQ